MTADGHKCCTHLYKQVCLQRCVFDEGLHSLLLPIGQHIEHHLTAALHHPKDGRSFLLQGATTSFALEPASTALALLALYYLWLAFIASSHIGFITLHLVGEDHGWLFFTMPPRSSVVI